MRQKCPYSELFWSLFFPHFAAFGLNTERYSVCLRIQSEFGKIRTRITPNTDTFYAAMVRGVKWSSSSEGKISLNIKPNFMFAAYSQTESKNPCVGLIVYS